MKINNIITSATWEYASVIFFGIAVLGATQQYLLALATMFPLYWMRQKNKKIRQLKLDIESLGSQQTETRKVLSDLVYAEDRFGYGASMLHPRVTKAICAAKRFLTPAPTLGPNTFSR